MKVILEVTTGPDAPRSFVVESGEEIQIGRTAPARILLSNDRTVSRLHFSIRYDGRTCRIRDLGSSHGTTLNGLAVTEALVSDGDLIVAGSTGILVRMSDDAVPAVPREGVPGPGWPEELLPTEPGTGRGVAPVPGASSDHVQGVEDDRQSPEESFHERLLAVLRSQKQPLFAVLDAARDPLVYVRVTECLEQKQSLYEGPEAARLGFVAPYLIMLPKDSAFLGQLVREGWGNAWGVYLTCDRPFDEVRRHLRHFLTVELEGKKQKVLFRFYDPRVLRVFLPTSDPGEIARFFGPISHYLCEGEEPGDLLDYAHRPGTGALAVSRLVAAAG